MKDSRIRYFTNCRPLLLIPELAQEIGIPRSLILNQFRYWLYKTKHNTSKFVSVCSDCKGRVIKNHYWIRESYSTLLHQLKCIKKTALKSNIKWLKEHDYIYVFNGSSPGTKSYGMNWYTLNSDKLNRLYNKSKYTPGVTKDYQKDVHVTRVSNASTDTLKTIKNLRKQKDEYKKRYEKIAKASNSGAVDRQGGSAYEPPRSANDQGVVRQTNHPSSPDGQVRGSLGEHPSNKITKTNTKSSSKTVDDQVEQISNSSFNKITGLYEKLFSSQLSPRGLEIMGDWTKRWDDVLLEKSLYYADAKIEIRREPVVLKYVSKILMEFRAKGITDVAGLYRFKAQQRKQFNKRLDQQYANDGDHGGTASDMQTHTFYQQMCQVVAGKRTGDMLFPKVAPQDKENAKLVVNACYIVMRQKHTDNTADVDFEALAENNCAKARQILEMESA